MAASHYLALYIQAYGSAGAATLQAQAMPGYMEASTGYNIVLVGNANHALAL
jgi:hypothetical protein